MDGAPNFTLSEFQTVSVRPLTPTETGQANWHARILQQARNAVNEFYGSAPAGGEYQIHITSFLRTSGDHATGAAVDWNVRDRAGNRYDALTRWARDWLALRMPEAFAELIYEPGFSEGSYAHVHHSRKGFSTDTQANRAPQILDEIEEGIYKVATILPFPRPVSLTALALVAVGIIYLLSHKA